MHEFKADLHIHSVLSPCGSLDMSPVNIIENAAIKGLDIIGITDHNSTKHCDLIREIGAEKGIMVLTGAEVNSKEEIHCLAFFEKKAELSVFQDYLDQWMVCIKNDPDKFGDQVVVNCKEEIVYIEERSLFASLNQSVDEIEKKVHELNGLFIPAHVDRSRNSIYSQIGFFPEGLHADAIEVSKASNSFQFLETHNELKGFTVLRSSDAHFPEDIAKVYSTFRLREKSFDEIRLALRKYAGREVIIS